MGRHEEAEPLHRDAFQGRERTLGRVHPDTLTSLSNHAMALQALGRHSEAETLYRRALSCSETTLGPSHPHTLTYLNNLAVLLKTMRRYQEAEQLYIRALEGRKNTLGSTHPRTLTSLNNLSQLLQAMGRYREAEPLQRRAVKGRRAKLGATHPDTLSACSNLEALLQAMSRQPEEGGFGPSSSSTPQRSQRPAGAFLTKHTAPSGETWQACLLAADRPAVGMHGFIEGPWGECITAACVFEHNNPDWEVQREYTADGPAGQVMQFLGACGHGDLTGALARTEEATHAAIKSGRPVPVWASPANSAIHGLPVHDMPLEGHVVQGRVVPQAPRDA